MRKIRVVTSDSCYDFEGKLKVIGIDGKLEIYKMEKDGYQIIASFNHWNNWREIT